MEGSGASGNSIIILSCNLLYILMRETAGIIHTAGFVWTRENYGTVCTRTHYRYGVRGYGCGLGNLYPRYTRAEPYHFLHAHLQGGKMSGLMLPTCPHTIEKRPGQLNNSFFMEQNAGEGVPSFFFPPPLVIGLLPKLPTAAMHISPTTGSVCNYLPLKLIESLMHLTGSE